MATKSVYVVVSDMPMTAPRALARVPPDKHETCAYTEFCYAFPIKEPVLVDNTASAHASKKCPHAIRREGEGLHIRGDGYAVVAFSSGCRSESNGLHPKRIASRRHERFGYEAITLSRRERSRYRLPSSPLRFARDIAGIGRLDPGCICRLDFEC